MTRLIWRIFLIFVRMNGLQQLIEMAKQTSEIEWLAVLSLMVYVWLMARKNVLAWPMGILGSALYIWICYSTLLYLDAALQVCYVAFGIYGWIKWNSTGADFPIQTWALKTHVAWILAGVMLVVSLGWLAATFTAQQSPFVDATIFVFSLIATYMTAQKILENWIYWIAIDAVAVGLFYSKDLYLTSLLYVFYTVLAVIGWMRWKTEIKSTAT